MKFNFNKLFTPVLIAGTLVMVACNKDVANPKPIAAPMPTTTRTLADTVNNDPSLSILKAAVSRAATSSASPSLAALLADPTAQFTLFAPTDAAFQTAFAILGIPPAVGIQAFRPGQLDSLLRYHVVGGRTLPSSDTNAFRTTFPNVQLPTQLVLAAPSASLPPGLRNSVFTSRRGTAFWVNNVPIIQADAPLANGVLHKIALPLLPPSQFLWNRIDTDPNLTYLKAAIQRADSGSTTATSLVAALSNPAANLTVFAPNDTSFRSAITQQIALGFIQQGVPPATALAQATALAATPAVFSNPLLYPALTPTLVRGIVVYHVLGSRAFSVNLPPTATGGFRTLLNGGIPAHPGVTLGATFGPTGVTAATVRGLTNPSASVIIINPTPAPGGTSDQHYVNGVLHVIDQVLRPQ